MSPICRECIAPPGRSRCATIVSSRQESTTGQRRPIHSGQLIVLPIFPDERGVLTFAQVGDHLPFVPWRYYALMNVPAGAVRGEHAHRLLHRFISCLKGAVTITLDDAEAECTYRLDSPTLGLHIPPLQWSRLSHFTLDAVVLCHSSGEYDPDEYIRDYGAFLAAVRAP